MKRKLVTMALAATVGLGGALLAPIAANASAAPAVSNLGEPHSPSGIYSWSLCGSTNFTVFDGTYGHNFYVAAPPYRINNLTVRYTWNEQVWWGIVDFGGYNGWTVTCSA